MANSKKDFCFISKLVLDLINNLTDEQFNNLLHGTADIKYNEKGIDSEKREKYNEILHEIAIRNDIEKKDFIKNNSELKTKTKLIEFCKIFKIEYKSKDTIDILIDKIIKYVIKNKENILSRYAKFENLELGIDALSKKLEESMDVLEARKLLSEAKFIESKANLIKLSKRLNVFIDRESSYSTIVDNIIKSVVESKIRSYTIRKKI